MWVIISAQPFTSPTWEVNGYASFYAHTKQHRAKTFNYRDNNWV